METFRVPRRITTVFVLIAGLTFGSILTGAAQRYQDPNDEMPEFQSCDDEVSEFQDNVKKCLGNSETLEEAKGCWEI